MFRCYEEIDGYTPIRLQLATPTDRNVKRDGNTYRSKVNIIYSALVHNPEAPAPPKILRLL
jgi:hypothetical protein